MAENKKAPITINTTGTVSNSQELHLDISLPLPTQAKVQISITYNQDSIDSQDKDVWLKFLATNPAFAFLKDKEDIYSFDDGEPFKQ